MINYGNHGPIDLGRQRAFEYQVRNELLKETGVEDVIEDNIDYWFFQIENQKPLELELSTEEK